MLTLLLAVSCACVVLLSQWCWEAQLLLLLRIFDWTVSSVHNSNLRWCVFGGYW